MHIFGGLQYKIVSYRPAKGFLLKLSSCQAQGRMVQGALKYHKPVHYEKINKISDLMINDETRDNSNE